MTNELIDLVQYMHFRITLYLPSESAKLLEATPIESSAPARAKTGDSTLGRREGQDPNRPFGGVLSVEFDGSVTI